MDAKPAFLMLFKAPRENFIQTMTAEERTVMAAHAEHCKTLAAEGRIVLLGACKDGARGVLVFRADSEEAAREFFGNDPAVKSGIVEPELHPFTVILP